MHLTRAQATKKLPIPRKGTKYLARAASHKSEGIPVVIAIRDVLGLAKTAKEVKKMINNKMLRLNDKDVKDLKESVRLFSVLQADKNYKLSVLPTGRFTFEETKDSSRLCKVINKSLIRNGRIQLHLHDGTNVITEEKVNVHDSVYLEKSKIKEIKRFEKGAKVIAISGRSIGKQGAVYDVAKNKATVKMEDRDVVLGVKHLAVL